MSSSNSLRCLFVGTSCNCNKAFIDIRLRPSLATPRGALHFAVRARSYGPLRPNVTSSIKPEIHNVAKRRRRRTEPRPQGICTQNLCGSVQRFHRYARRQTDAQTDGSITILCTPTGANNNNNDEQQYASMCVCCLSN